MVNTAEPTKTMMGKDFSASLTSALVAFLGKNSLRALTPSEREFIDEHTKFVEFLINRNYKLESVAAEASKARQCAERSLEQERAVRLKQELELEDALERLADARAERQHLSLVLSTPYPVFGAQDLEFVPAHMESSNESKFLTTSSGYFDEYRFARPPLTLSGLCFDRAGIERDIKHGATLLHQTSTSWCVSARNLEEEIAAREHDVDRLASIEGSYHEVLADELFDWVNEICPKIIAVADAASFAGAQDSATWPLKERMVMIISSLLSDVNTTLVTIEASEDDDQSVIWNPHEVSGSTDEDGEYAIGFESVQSAFQLDYPVMASRANECFAFDFAPACPQLSMSDLFSEAKADTVEVAVNSKPLHASMTMISEVEYAMPSAPGQFAFEFDATRSHSCDSYSVDHDGAPQLSSMFDQRSEKEFVVVECDTKFESGLKVLHSAVPFDALLLCVAEEVTVLELDVARLQSVRGPLHEAFADVLLDRVREVSAYVMDAENKTADTHTNIDPARPLTTRMNAVISTLISDRTAVLAKFRQHILLQRGS